MNADRPLTVSSFPYNPGMNPYQWLFTRALEDAGVSVLRIPPRKWFPLHHALHQRCDILHLDWPHDWYQGRNWLTRLAKRQMYLVGVRRLERVPTIWTLHNLIAHDSLDVTYERRMLQALIDRCRGIMAMSHSAETELRRTFQIPSRVEIRVIPHGHYIDWYPNTVDGKEARDVLGIGQDETVYMCLGSLRPYKGQNELIRAFTNVALRRERLVIAGSAADKRYEKILAAAVSESKSDCKGQIDLHARIIGRDEAQIFFNASDICVLPYTNILNSGSLLLAMSFGKPVVAPQVGSIPEVAHPAAYTAYDSSDSGGLAAAIEAARNSHADSSYASAEEIRRFARASYDWSKIGCQLVEWYRDILEAPMGHRKLPQDVAKGFQTSQSS